MDIGGIDTTIPTQASKEDQIAVMRSYCRIMWPSMAEEEDPSGEWFFYANANVAKDWDKKGRTDDNAELMIHVVPGDDSVTYVHECMIDCDVINALLLERQRVLTRVYCGTPYPQGTAAAKHQALYDHIKVCPEHPLSKALVALRECHHVLRKGIEVRMMDQWPALTQPLARAVHAAEEVLGDDVLDT